MPNPLVVNETVRAAKEYIDGELKKCKTWDDACADKSISTKFVTNSMGFVKLKKQGAGRDVLSKFLGGHWKQWVIQDALPKSE